MDREPDFKNSNGNIKVLTSQKSDFSNKNQEWDAKILYNRENSFSTENQEIGADSNKKILSDKAI